MQKLLYHWQLSIADPFRMEEQSIPPGFVNPHCDMHSAVHLGILRQGSVGDLQEQYDIFFTAAWEVHGKTASADGAELLLITASPEALLNTVIGDRSAVKRLLYLPCGGGAGRFRIPELQRKAAEFCAVYDRLKHHAALPEVRQQLWLHTAGLFYDTALCLAENPGGTEQKKFLVLQKVLSVMAELKNIPLTVAQAAKICCMSESYFSHVFRECAGMGFARYELLFRLNCAAAELAEKDVSIKQIAGEWGFYDASHFCKSYKKFFGVTPSCYRSR